MSDVKGMVDSAVAALKAGKKSEARTTLTQAVDLDPKNEQAWLYLSALVPSLEEQEICLENVLTINPGNDRAKKALDIVLDKQGKPPRSAAPPPAPAPPPPAPAADSGWDSVNSGSGGGGWGDIDVANWDDLVSSVTPSDPPPTPSPAPVTTPAPAADGNADWLENIETNPWQTDESDPVVSGGWDIPSDPIPSSVDWGNDSTIAAHGSGLNVEQPNDEEYDSWISGMNLGGGSNSESTNEATSDVDDFGGFDTTTKSASSDGDPFDTSNWSDGWTTPGLESKSAELFGDSTVGANDNPFADDLSSNTMDDFRQPSLSRKSGGSEFDSFLEADSTSDSDDSDDLSGYSFDFDDEEDSTYAKAVDVDEDFLALDFIDEIEEATGARKMNLGHYFAQIPDEIDVKIKSGGGGRLGIIMLLLMNVAAAIGLIVQAG